MDKNKLIMGALIVVVLALLIGVFFAMTNSAKDNSNLEIISNSTK